MNRYARHAHTTKEDPGDARDQITAPSTPRPEVPIYDKELLDRNANFGQRATRSLDRLCF